MNDLHAFDVIKNIAYECYMQPKVAESKMRNSLNLTLKYQNKLWTRILLERLVMKNIGTNEVVKFAKNQAMKSENKFQFQPVIRNNINLKLIDVRVQEKHS